MVAASDARSQLFEFEGGPTRMIPVDDEDTLVISLRVMSWLQSARSTPISIVSDYPEHFVNPGPSTILLEYGYQDIPIYYIQGSNMRHGMAMIILGDSDFSDTIVLQAHPADSIMGPGTAPRFIPDVISSYSPPGYKRCTTFELINDNYHPMVVDSITTPEASHSIEGRSYPFTIAGEGGKVELQYCFAPGESHGWWSYDRSDVTVHYRTQESEGAITSLRAYGITPPCVIADPDTAGMPPIVVGGWIEVASRVENLSTDTVTVTWAGPINQTPAIVNAVVLNALPGVLLPGASVDIKLKLQGTSAGRYDVSAYINQEKATPGRCGHTGFIFTGYVVEATSDSMRLELFPTELQTIILKGEPQPAIRTFTFTNNSSTDIKIQNVSLSSGEHFEIVAITPTAPPLSLAPNASMTLDIQFDADSNGFYTDSLVIVIDNSITTMSIPIQAVQSQASQLGLNYRTAIPIDFVIVPNPSKGPVSIRLNGASESSIAVYDILGRSIMHHSEGELDLPAGTLESGTYIIRATGKAMNGESFILSRKLVQQ